MSFWNPSQDREARINACKGAYSPEKYTVRVDDEHARWRYRLASTALWGQSVGIPSFFILCAEYVIQHHRGLKNVRRAIRQAERQIEKDKKARAREARAAYLANPGMYQGEPPEPLPKRHRRRKA